MKVVIDIPPEIWALVREGIIPVRAYECIVKGTPLPRWIPVNERLPEHSGNYLISIADSNYVSGQAFKTSWFYPSDHRWSFKNANILAWMPLPEPYKAESEETNADSD